jgi:hypothetical protein
LDFFRCIRRRDGLAALLILCPLLSAFPHQSHILYFHDLSSLDLCLLCSLIYVADVQEQGASEKLARVASGVGLEVLWQQLWLKAGT